MLARVAEFADLGGEALGVEVDAALALDRLHDDAGGLVVDGALEGVEVARLDVR